MAALPQTSQTAEVLSRNLGSRTVLSGSVTQGKDSNSQSLQMMERPLMSPDELKSMPRGSFVIMKTGTHPMKTKLKLFLDWGIRFEKPLEIPDRGSRRCITREKRSWNRRFFLDARWYIPRSLYKPRQR